jgi:hypothetical protein
MLYGMLGATNNIPLGSTASEYIVTPTTFVSTEYPISTLEPT